MLQAEQAMHQQQLEALTESPAERKSRMEARAAELKEKRENERLAFVRQQYERHEYLITKHAQQFVTNPFLNAPTDGGRVMASSSRGSSAATRRPGTASGTASASALGVSTLREADVLDGIEQPAPPSPNGAAMADIDKMLEGSAPGGASPPDGKGEAGEREGI